jgi:nucleoside-diphosphate-sugar epimerase
MPMTARAVVLGARSIIAPYLLTRLADLGYAVECIVRQAGAKAEASTPARSWTVLDVRTPGAWSAPRDAVVFSLLPLWLLPPLMANLKDARQIIAFGSTSAMSKGDSADRSERELAQRLRDAEADLVEACSRMALPWTLLRPTLVYGGGRDRNISVIAGIVRRFGFFALPAPGLGLRQPVHADDLAGAALLAVDNPVARDTTFDLPGGEALTYREMVQRIFRAVNCRPRILLLPEPVLATMVAGLRRLGVVDAAPEVVRRMNQDLTVDGAPARTQLGYRPRPFAPELSGERRQQQ